VFRSPFLKETLKRFLKYHTIISHLFYFMLEYVRTKLLSLVLSKELVFLKTHFVMLVIPILAGNVVSLSSFFFIVYHSLEFVTYVYSDFTLL